MAKIHYKKIRLPYVSQKAFITISEIYNDGGEDLTVSIFPSTHSHVMIGEKRYKLKSGAVTVPANEIPRGISEVTFISGTEKLCASPIFNDNGSFGRAPIDHIVARDVEIALTAIGKTLLGIEERLSELEEYVKPKNMFNFN